MPKGKVLRNMLQPFTSQLRACVWVSLPHNNNDLWFWGIDQAAMQACSSVQTGNTLIYHLLFFLQTSGSPAPLWASQQAPHSHLIPPQGLRNLCAHLPPSCCCLADLLPPPCPTQRKYLGRKISGKMEPSMSFRTTSCVPDPLTAGRVTPLLCGTVQLLGRRAKQTIPIRKNQQGV